MGDHGETEILKADRLGTLTRTVNGLSVAFFSFFGGIHRDFGGFARESAGGKLVFSLLEKLGIIFGL